jgi:hypothetical protein
MTHSLKNTAVWNRTIIINHSDKYPTHKYFFYSADKLVNNMQYTEVPSYRMYGNNQETTHGLMHRFIWGLQDLLPCSAKQEISDNICDITFVIMFSEHLLHGSKKNFISISCRALIFMCQLQGWKWHITAYIVYEVHWRCVHDNNLTQT